YVARHIQRWHLGTGYMTVAEDVKKMFADGPLKGTVLGVDQTGVGVPVVEVLRAARIDCRLYPITITAGLQASRQDDGWHVAKVQLVSTAQVLLQSRRLEIVPTLPEAKMLSKELLSFKVRITPAANETYAAWREGDKDDLVLALCMAAWLGEK